MEKVRDKVCAPSNSIAGILLTCATAPGYQI
jgi:hypothetical protein